MSSKDRKKELNEDVCHGEVLNYENCFPMKPWIYFGYEMLVIQPLLLSGSLNHANQSREGMAYC